MNTNTLLANVLVSISIQESELDQAWALLSTRRSKITPEEYIENRIGLDFVRKKREVVNEIDLSKSSQDNKPDKLRLKHKSKVHPFAMFACSNETSLAVTISTLFPRFVYFGHIVSIFVAILIPMSTEIFLYTRETVAFVAWETLAIIITFAIDTTSIGVTPVFTGSAFIEINTILAVTNIAGQTTT